MVHISFKKGFEKKAALGEILTALGSMALAPTVKRYGFKSFDYAKRKGMGLGPRGGKNNPIMEYIYNDIDKVQKMKPGLRKSINKFIMEETPLMGIWMGPSQGKNLGEKMKGATKFIPKPIKSTLSDLTSADEKIVEDTMKKIKGTGLLAGSLGLGAGLAGGILKSKIKKKPQEKQENPEMLKSAGRITDAFKVLFGKATAEPVGTNKVWKRVKKWGIPINIGLKPETEKYLNKVTSPKGLILGGLSAGGAVTVANRLVENNMTKTPTEVKIVRSSDGSDGSDGSGTPQQIMGNGFNGSETLGDGRTS